MARTRPISGGSRKPVFITLGALCHCPIYAKSRRSGRTPTTLSIKSGEPSYGYCLVARHDESLPTSRPCQQFPSIWSAVPAVISEAERASRVELPEFWKVHEAAGTSSRVLSVWGIWIEPVSGIATYEVSTNQDFDPPRQMGLSSFPEESYVMIERNKEGFIRAKAR